MIIASQRPVGRLCECRACDQHASAGPSADPKTASDDERGVCFRIERFTDTNPSPVAAHASTLCVFRQLQLPRECLKLAGYSLVHWA